jgi:hypothetical protein
VAANRTVWTIRDAGGYPAPKTSSGQRAQPFWSSRSRAQNIITAVAAYAGFVPEEIGWACFCASWVPELAADGVLVGINWSGQRATGYDLPPGDVQRNLEAVIAASVP